MAIDLLLFCKGGLLLWTDSLSRAGRLSPSSGLDSTSWRTECVRVCVCMCVCVYGWGYFNHGNLNCAPSEARSRGKKACSGVLASSLACLLNCTFIQQTLVNAFHGSVPCCVCSVAQSCLIKDPVQSQDCSLPGSSVHGMSSIQEGVAISFSRVSSWPRDWTLISCIAGSFLTKLPE